MECLHRRGGEGDHSEKRRWGPGTPRKGAVGAHVTGQVSDDGVVGELCSAAVADVFPGVSPVEQHGAKRERGGIGVCAYGGSKRGNRLMVRAERQLAACDAGQPLCRREAAAVSDSDVERRAMFANCLQQVGADLGDVTGPGAVGCCRQQGLFGIRQPVPHGADLGASRPRVRVLGGLSDQRVREGLDIIEIGVPSRYRVAAQEAMHQLDSGANPAGLRVPVPEISQLDVEV